jgi:DNA adenine methylase
MSSILETQQQISFLDPRPEVRSTRAQPFIKWAGGKQALLSQIVSKLPKEVGRYVEPFVGGGAVFFALSHPTSTISDLNWWLIDSYQAIRDDWQAVAKELDRIPNSKEDFLRVRAVDPLSLSLPKRAAHFIYLNKTCFRGLFRVNKQGRFNVPYGAYDRRYYDPSVLAAAATALEKCEIKMGDFEAALLGLSSDDFVYLDPPYYKLGGFSDFNRYTSGQFREIDQLRLASVCNELDRNGVRWAHSNSDTPFIRSLYKRFRLVEVSARREINLNSQDRNVTELLILNY